VSVDPFINAINRQLTRAVSLPSFRYDAEVSVSGMRFKSVAVTALTERHLYLENLFEDIQVTVAMQASHYTELVLHGHEDMTMKLTQRPYEGGTPYTKEYHAVIISHQDGKRDGNITDVAEPGALDLTTFSVITFQLITSAAFDLRLREIGAIYPNCCAVDVLRHYLAKTRLHDRLSQTEAVATVTVEPGASQRKFNPIKIPEGTRFMAFPDYLQREYGIYAQGLGCFLRGLEWHIFAPFNITKRDYDIPRLVVFNAPPARYRDVPKNFHIVGKTVTVIATGETKHRRYSDEDALNGGTGVRYADMRSINGNTSTSDPTVDPERLPEQYMTEYRGSRHLKDIQNTVTSSTRFSDNPLVIASVMAQRGGEVVDVTWLHGTLEPLRPGMPTTFYYGANGVLKQRYGTLLSAELVSSIPQKGFIEPEHRNVVRLSLFLKDDGMM
jgi:hypothetical protein